MDRFARAAVRLAGLPGVVGVFHGVRRRAGAWTNEPTLSFHVHRKLPSGDLPRDERIPRWLDGVATDVLAVGRPRLYGTCVDSLSALRASYDDRGRNSAVTALAADDDALILALGSGHGLLPIKTGGFETDTSWTAAAGMTVDLAEGDHVLSGGTLWFGKVGHDRDFALARFPDLVTDAAHLGHSYASCPIPYALAGMVLGAPVYHLARRRGSGVTGTVNALAVPGQTTSLWSEAGIMMSYSDVAVVVGQHVPFGLEGESGSLVFTAHGDESRAVGFVVGGGSDPNVPHGHVTYILHDFAALEEDLQGVFPRFFRSASS